MKYTLIIPHYNDTTRLERLLKSVPVFRADLEVIVIDDCSPDQRALSILKQSWPKVIWQSTPKNSGAGAGRNIGLLNASGKYLIFSDSDDEFSPNAFDVFDENVEGKNDLFYFLAEGRQEVDGTTSVRAGRLNAICLEYLEKKTHSSLEKLRLEQVVPWAKVYSKEAVSKLDIRFEETRVSNDISFNVLAALQIKNIKVIPEVVYKVYRRRGSLTADPTAEAFLERMEVSARLSTKLKYLNSSYTRSAIGYIVRSFSYDLDTVLKAIYIGIFSDLKLSVFTALNPWRWFSFLHTHLSDKREKKSADK